MCSKKGKKNHQLTADPDIGFLRKIRRAKHMFLGLRLIKYASSLKHCTGYSSAYSPVGSCGGPSLPVCHFTLITASVFHFLPLSFSLKYKHDVMHLKILKIFSIKN